MNSSRDVFLFNSYLEEIRELMDKEYEGKKDENIDLSDEDKALVDGLFAGEIEYKTLSFEAQMYCSLKLLISKQT